MEDLGQPSAYPALKPGLPVYSSDGERLGKIERILADLDANIFDGIVFDTSALPGGHRFVDAPEVEMIYDRGVVLKITAAEVSELPPPTANPGSLSVKPGDLAGGKPSALRRAWDRISGKG
jgi:PRC-barrel domain protein